MFLCKSLSSFTCSLRLNFADNALARNFPHFNQMILKSAAHLTV